MYLMKERERRKPFGRSGRKLEVNMKRRPEGIVYNDMDFIYLPRVTIKRWALVTPCEPSVS
jgi:hypothetical protein